MRRLVLFLTTLCFAAAAGVVHASDASSVPENKRTSLQLYLTPAQAWDIVRHGPDDVLFIDVRTRAEAVYVGMPEAVDALVPFADHDPFWSWDDKRNTYKVEPQQDFVTEVNRRLAEKGLGKQDTVIVICRSGTRSAMAADRLAQDGYTKVYSVVEGFEGDSAKAGPHKGQRAVNGWKNAGLPWTYKLEKNKMYLRE